MTRWKLVLFFKKIYWKNADVSSYHSYIVKLFEYGYIPNMLYYYHAKFQEFTIFQTWEISKKLAAGKKTPRRLWITQKSPPGIGLTFVKLFCRVCHYVKVSNLKYVSSAYKPFLESLITFYVLVVRYSFWSYILDILEYFILCIKFLKISRFKKKIFEFFFHSFVNLRLNFSLC